MAMGTLQQDSIVKNAIKNLCCSYGWSYGAFWSYDQPNSILLTLQDAYFEEKCGSLIDNLVQQVPLGGGIIGQAAYNNKHTWMSSEDHYNEQNFSGSIWDMFLDDYEFCRQFSCGLKTIAVIPVEPQGVVQFGSIDKILETMEFVNQTKSMFQEILNLGGSEVGLTSLDGQTCYQNEAFASLISPQESFFTDFGIPDEFFQNGNFPPLNPIDSDGKHDSLTISGTDVDLLRNSGDLGHILAPFIDGSHSGFHSYSSECMSMSKSAQRVDCTTLGPKERLFSKLGIEELLEGVSGISNADSLSCIDGQISAKRRKTGNSKWVEDMPISQPGLRMVDGYSVSDSSTIMQAKKQVEPLKPIKKKAKPGTRPRPKDRQQILDRMAELRLLIPNGEKMSIDCLLDRTIKHMIFMQNLAKQADKIKQAEERKHNRIDSNDTSTNGVTWACELGNQTMVCPLMVEDLDEPGQMLIEMICKEQGFFLEIVDIIRRFGLIILKGVMETRGDKIWARFIVEPEVNKQITRHEIFSALVKFLQANAHIVDEKCTRQGNSLLGDFQQAGIQNIGIQNLVNLADMQYFVNLQPRF